MQSQLLYMSIWLLNQLCTAGLAWQQSGIGDHDEVGYVHLVILLLVSVACQRQLLEGSFLDQQWMHKHWRDSLQHLMLLGLGRTSRNWI